MISVTTSLGVERTITKDEMQRILNLEKAIANVGESFRSFHSCPMILKIIFDLKAQIRVILFKHHSDRY